MDGQYVVVLKHDNSDPQFTVKFNANEPLIIDPAQGFVPFVFCVQSTIHGCPGVQGGGAANVIVNEYSKNIHR